jgi:hypothetical protein
LPASRTVLAGVSDKVMVAFPQAAADGRVDRQPVRADIALDARAGGALHAGEGPLRILVSAAASAHRR